MRRGWFDRGGTGGAKDSMRTIPFRHRLPALPTALALAAGVIGCGSEKGPTEPAIPPVASVQVTPAFDTLTALGQTHQLAAVAKDASGAAISGKTFTWASSAPSVVSVDAATGPGSVTITAAARGIPGTAALAVAQAATKLGFSVPPTNATAGQAMSPAVQVEIRDAGGGMVSGARDAVTLVLETNPASGTLSGTKTVKPVGGGATFSGL